MQPKCELNISRKRTEFYFEFIINLLDKIYKSYPGRECMDSDDIKNHFNWAYLKICDLYIKENIDFSENEELKSFFFDYYLVSFYESKTQDYNPLYKYWDNLFNYKNELIKNPHNVRTLVNIYLMFENTINNKKSIAFAK